MENNECPNCGNDNTVASEHYEGEIFCLNCGCIFEVIP